jgi:hypothetical protein
MEFNDFDAIMDDINKVYDDLENEYNEYIKTLQIVPYKPIDFTLLIYLNCLAAYFNYMSKLIILQP